MEFENLQLNVDQGNTLEISPETKFLASKISIVGSGCKVHIEKALIYERLEINLAGNNKSITIRESHGKIKGLKISSTRGDNQLVDIGKNLSLGGMHIRMNDGDEAFYIGDDCLFSWDIDCRTSDGHSVIDRDTGRPVNFPRDIKIGSHVWIGESVRILKGAIIPADSVVGSFSVVTRKFKEPNVVIAGHPAKVVKENVTWNRENPVTFKT